jgi:hypothetical protein
MIAAARDGNETQGGRFGARRDGIGPGAYRIRSVLALFSPDGGRFSGRMAVFQEGVRR